jgi:hypothetical protein
VTGTDQFFTWASLGTFHGSALAAVIIPNVLGKVFGFPGRARLIIAFSVALILQVVLAAFAEGDGAEKWIVAIFNGFLVAASALGVNQSTVSATEEGFEASQTPRRFRRSWL